MRARGFGRILFTSSIAALTGGIGGPHYAASKAGLHGLTHFLASQVARDGVTVNAIAPALIAETRMLPGDPGELAARVPLRSCAGPKAATRTNLSDLVGELDLTFDRLDRGRGRLGFGCRGRGCEREAHAGQLLGDVP